MFEQKKKRLKSELVYTATAAAALLYIYKYIHNIRFEEADCGCVNGGERRVERSLDGGLRGCIIPTLLYRRLLDLKVFYPQNCGSVDS